MKKVKNKKKKLNIINLVITIILTILTVLLIINLIRLANIETLLRIIVIFVLCLILIGLIIFQKKKRILCRIIMIILSIIYIFLNYTFYRVYTSLDSITKKVDTKGICLVANSLDIKNIDDMDNSDIAIVGETMDEVFYEMATDIVDNENLSNKLVQYEDYFQIINALLNDEIKYAFLPENYNDIYSANREENTNEKLQFSILYTEQKLIESKNEQIPVKTLDEPFTILLMGTDVMLDSYNADTLMVVTVNPKTMKATMLSIPRDTYTTIACTGGKHKINSSGWYGDNCVVRTVENYLDIDIDYYAKINFLGVVNLVDVLGGVEVDVPYAFCEQNSKRQWGKNTVFVNEGLQILDGEQALALTRNRHYWKGTCDPKYTTNGERSDLTRGANQQLVIKAIISKLMTIRDINTFYDILDTIGNNMTTNMPRDTILSLYNIGKKAVKRLNASDADDIINIEKLTFKSYSTMIHISGLDLSMIINYNESVNYVTKQMKKNLGLIKTEPITDFSFDINEEYNPETIKYNKLTSNLNLFSSLIGKNLGEALSYCNKNGIKCESSSTNNNAIVINQSIAPKTDISTMKNKTVVLEVENASTDRPNNSDSNDTNIIPDNKENETNDDTNNKEENQNESNNKENIEDNNTSSEDDNTSSEDNNSDKPNDDNTNEEQKENKEEEGEVSSEKEEN